MKTTVLTTLTAIALLGTGAAQVSQPSLVAPVPAHHLTDKQASRLIDTASTPWEHRELAQYFRQEAQRNRDREQYYLEFAMIYRLHPPRVDMYRNLPTHNYYQHLADGARAAALADDQLATYQEKLAEGLATAK